MRILSLFCLVVLLLIPAAATVADFGIVGSGLYISSSGGLAMMPDTTDTEQDINGDTEADWDMEPGFGLSSAIGYDFGDFRADAEFSFLSAKFDHDATEAADADDSFTIIAVTANAWYDQETGTPFSPYIGAGVGIANLTANIPDDDDEVNFDGNAWGLAYQIGAGVGYEITEGLSLTAGYQFIGTIDKTEIKDSSDDDKTLSPSLMAHQIKLGVLYEF